MGFKNKRHMIIQILNILEGAVKDMPDSLSTVIIKKFGRDPFLILISCLLSLRAKDKKTIPIVLNLFKIVRTPQQILNTSYKKLKTIIYPIGFYRKKIKYLYEASEDIISNFGGKVPNDFQSLLSIRGVGRKTANLVLSQAFNIPAICVDTHVHQISNRLGLIKTNTVIQTEVELKKITPRKYWAKINNLFVLWGQNVCVSVSPFCSKCALYRLCDRIGVKKFR